MTAPKTPTLLDDLKLLHEDAELLAVGTPYKPIVAQARDRLHAFLSPLTPSLVEALSDTGMRAALEAAVESLPEIEPEDADRPEQSDRSCALEAASGLAKLIVRALKAKEEV